MNYNDYKELLTSAFEKNGYKEIISDNVADKFYRFSNLLVETNKQFNLTAITDENEIILKHFVDCYISRLAGWCIQDGYGEYRDLQYREIQQPEGRDATLAARTYHLSDYVVLALFVAK
jgi:hypothetical protein